MSRPLGVGKWRIGVECCGFRVTRVRPTPVLPCIAVEARHLRTGARFLHLAADDPEDLFAIAVRTPPPDDTGVPHILEHSVLGGSRKYPVKDPFVEMLKMSMATFINAMTYPDRTVYPVASTVKKDFFNLADVYFDAVFHPNISPLTLDQEGHHLEFVRPGDVGSPLTIKGIVYNEMKGAYSDLDSVVDRISTRGLFPDTPYGRDSGGDPEAIPRLTYPRFRGFLERFYHPSNAFFFVYGGIPTEEHFAFLDARLRDCPDRRDIRVRIRRQPRWTAPRETTVAFPIGPGEDPDRRAAVTMNWLVSDVSDVSTNLAMNVVDHLLLGTAAAPLRKALVDSRLGEDLTPSGFAEGTRETSFHVGLKGTSLACRGEIVALIEDVLRQTACRGFAPDKIENALHQLEYGHREIQGMFPLRLMGWVYNAWLYGLDPLTFLRTAEQIDALRGRVKQDPGLFSRLIREHLLDNPHRLTAVVKPEVGLLQQREKALARRLARRKRRMSVAELEAIARRAAELDRLQSAPNPPEAVAALPQLRLKDVPPDPRAIPTELIPVGHELPLLRNDIFANGVNYLVLAFDLGGLPREFLADVSVLTALFSRMGAAGRSYAETADRIAAVTGGVSAGVFAATQAVDPNRTQGYFTISFKALDKKFPDALELVRDLLFELDLSDVRRLKDVLTQAQARGRAAIVPSGHQFAARRAARFLSGVSGLSELWYGVSALRTGEEMLADFDRREGELRRRLERVREHLLRSASVAASFTGTPVFAEPVAEWLRGAFDRRSQASCGGGELTSPPPPAPPVREGLAIESDVAFCARALRAPHASSADAPLLRVFSQLAAFEYMWEEIRVKGGAYGGMSMYDSVAGALTFLSYRDPSVARTIAVFDRVREYVERSRWTPEDVERAVIGCAKADERPVRPGPATSTALRRFLIGLDDSLRRERRQALLGVSADDVRAAALRVLDDATNPGNTCVVGAREELERASAELSEPLIIEDILPGRKPPAGGGRTS
ncbi:MAG: hypothetical protein GXP31_06595 [Kiritimatiellaeota bacterium]|nr:hypothetical protein [Kiritimatiellota bacterium]